MALRDWLALPDDDVIAAWVKKVNRGVPPFHLLPESGKEWWRERYAFRHGLTFERD